MKEGCAKQLRDDKRLSCPAGESPEAKSLDRVSAAIHLKGHARTG